VGLADTNFDICFGHWLATLMVVKRVVLSVVGVSNSCSFSHVLFIIGTISFIFCIFKIKSKKIHATCMWRLERAFLFLVLGRGCATMYLFVPIQYVIDNYL